MLLDAAPEILAHYPQAKFIIAGKGPYLDALKNQASALGMANRVYFTGYISDEVRNSLYSWADVAVFPSLYEPFGIVALEAMAARTPVVVSDCGGISEIVRHGVDGLKANTGNSHSLAQNILALLRQPQLGESREKRLTVRLQKNSTGKQSPVRQLLCTGRSGKPTAALRGSPRRGKAVSSGGLTACWPGIAS